MEFRKVLASQSPFAEGVENMEYKQRGELKTPCSCVIDCSHIFQIGLGIWFVLAGLLSMGFRTRFYCLISEAPVWEGGVVQSGVTDKTVFNKAQCFLCSFELLKDMGVLIKQFVKIKLGKIQGKMICYRKYFEEIGCLVITAYKRITGSKDKAL